MSNLRTYDESYPPSIYEPEVPEGDPQTGPTPFDPGECTIAEVLAYLDDHPDETERVLEAEESGKNRVRLITDLEDRLTAPDEDAS